MSHTAAISEILKDYGEDGNGRINGDEIVKLLPDYNGIIDFLPDNDNSVIVDPADKDAKKQLLTHQRLKKFVSEEFDLSCFGLNERDRVSILIPNGAIVAVAIVALLHRWCVAPINPASTYFEIRDELISTKSRCVLVLKDDPVGKLAIKAAEELHIGAMVLIPDPNTSGLFKIESILKINEYVGSKPPIVAKSVKDLTLSKHPETVLLLHTSGTSGNKKLVPYSLDMIVIGVCCIIKSWNLSQNDVCLNMMPLFHIGGIMRNVLSPMLSGGCVITCSGFDPFLFWNILYSSQRVTWYYASPTMHHALLQESQNRPKPLPVQNIRFIANAAGGLLPVLARSLKDTFQATILTSYGMTECMPISSPPQNYNLDPSGTSGIPVGPTIIIVDDSMVTKCPPNVKGNVLVKGEPCFGGYENNEGANAESFYTVEGESGWFDTGDCGMLDENNYLFISGRSKEIINRGGETISPFEIEEVIVQHPHVKETLAFSAPHETYQEVVGCVIVSKNGMPRVDLVSLHQYLDGKLHRSKWPMVIVYMDALPKNLTGKILRIKLADRLSMANVDENLPPLLRLFEATTPVVGAPLTQKIPMTNIQLDTSSVDDVLMQMGDVKTVLVDLSFKPNALVTFVALNNSLLKQLDNTEDIKLELHELCMSKLHMYLQPSFIHIISTDEFSKTTDFNELAHSMSTKPIALAKSKTEKLVLETWNSHLNLSRPLGTDDNFFELGGDSLKAGQLVSAMRRTFGIYNLSVGDLLNAPTIEAISSRIDELFKVSNQSDVSGKSKHHSDSEKDTDIETGVFDSDKDSASDISSKAPANSDKFTYYNNSLTCMLVQFLPLGFVYPFKYVSRFFMFIVIWQQLVSHQIVDRYVGLILAAIFAQFIMLIVAPLVAISLKWIVIGKYKAGTYPLWGSYYLRWWFVHHASKLFGFGVFGMDLPFVDSMLPLYYTLLGAKIGKNVKIAKTAVLGEPDLLTIDDGAWVDMSNVRPFTLEENHFSLLPIRIGKNCVIGKKCYVHAGAVIQDDVCLGPCSSSHEQNDAVPENRQYCQFALPSCSIFLRLFVKFPVTLLVSILCRAPYILLVYAMIVNSIQNDYGIESFESLKYVILWWATPQRFIFYYAIAITARCFTPFLHLFLVILAKRCIIGTFVPMTAEEKSLPWNAMRYSLMDSLMSGDSLGGVTKLVGSHYEIVSIIYRLLGAKIGKRVYWPGSGIHIVEYDLLEVGNDVVFGSRSLFMTSSGNKSDKIILGDGCMIADRCVLMPGVVVGRCAVLGSGGLAKEDMKLPVGSVYVGSRNGSAVMAQPEDLSYLNSDTITPFGKAFYNHQAPYFVIPLWLVVCYNFIWQAFSVTFRYTPLLMALYCAKVFVIDRRVIPYSSYSIYSMVLVFYICINFGASIMALSIEVAGKWLVIGRRVAGEYRWDKSSYCQRWQIYITLQSIRGIDKSSILELIEGSYFLVLFFRALGCTIGKNVCLYPNGGDPMMTEPDLVTLGDNVSVDDASLIAHVNTRGDFRLNKLNIGNGCVLKSGSRLLSGANMECRSMMLEHTLVMSGETCDSETVWQGWPSNIITPLSIYRNDLEKSSKYSKIFDMKENSIFLSESDWYTNNPSTNLMPKLVDVKISK